MEVIFNHFGVPPAKVIEWLGISKATLFRWEKIRMGLVRRVTRGMKSERRYSQSDLAWICEKVRAAQPPEAAEFIVWTKIVQGNPEGLEELRRLPRLSNEMAHRLLKLLCEFYDPGERDGRFMISTICGIILEVVERMVQDEAGGDETITA